MIEVNSGLGQSESDDRIEESGSEEMKNALRSNDEEIYLESMKDKEAGKIVKGTIVRVDQNEVYVDIGYKSEGTISLQEFTSLSGQLKANVGDEIEVFIQQQEDKEGKVVLSKTKVDRRKIWDTLAEIFDKQEVMDVKIIKQIKGGYLCNIGVDAFLPSSQAIPRVTGDEANNLIGRVLKVRIIKFDKSRGNVVLSHRVILDEQKKKLKGEVLSTIKTGEIRKGKVKSLTSFGAFVEIGGVDGLLHISDIAWQRLSDPSEVLKIGDELDLMVLSIDITSGKVSLGLKQLKPDPWTIFEQKYKEGSIINGKVSHLASYGIFIALEDGVEGLIHVSEISWTQRVTDISQNFSIGQDMQAIILKIDKTTKRISLGMRQLNPNPWEQAIENIMVGSRVSGVISSLTDYGAFVEISEGVDGLIHNSDLSWSSRIHSAKEALKKGDKIDTVVLSVDKEKHRISLGLKQLSPDPWTIVPTKYKVGDIVTGKIVRLTHFGAFVELEPDIEGLLHISQMDTKRVEKVEAAVQIGEEKIMKIINIVPEERKISLSIRKYLRDQGKEKNPEKMDDISLGSIPDADQKYQF